MTQTTRILLADDHKMLREGLRLLLEAESGMKVVGEAENGRIAVRMAEELSPDVVVMDISMPDLNGIEATRQIRNAKPSSDRPKVVALSAHAEQRHIADMLRAGATGYVLKVSAFEEMATAVRTVMENNVYLSPSVAGPVFQELPEGGNVSGTGSKLSPREMEILQLIAEGKATKEAAAALHVSVKTVETHRRNLMEKLNLDSVAELTKFAIREGITSLDG
jgi:two-component system response regulator NreC